MSTTYINIKGDDVYLSVHVQPGAKSTQWSGMYGDRIKIRLSAPPVDGQANEALCRFLAREFDWPARDVNVLRGLSGRQKTICFVAAAPHFDKMAQHLNTQI